MAYYDWFCTTFISSDWRTWNTVIDAERGLFISWPLSVFLTVHVVAFLVLFNLVANLVIPLILDHFTPSHKWYARGFAEGAHSKAVKLANIKYSKNPAFEEGCILWQVDPSLEKEAAERFVALCGRIGAECAAKRKEA